MKCPKCGKFLKPQARQCTRCGTVFKRKSDALVRKMTLNGGYAVTCGGVLMFIAVILFFYSDWTVGAILMGLGAVLALIGWKMG